MLVSQRKDKNDGIPRNDLEDFDLVLGGSDVAARLGLKSNLT